QDSLGQIHDEPPAETPGRRTLRAGEHAPHLTPREYSRRSTAEYDSDFQERQGHRVNTLGAELLARGLIVDRRRLAARPVSRAKTEAIGVARVPAFPASLMRA